MLNVFEFSPCASLKKAAQTVEKEVVTNDMI
jgi:hypothetical protein